MAEKNASIIWMAVCLLLMAIMIMTALLISKREYQRGFDAAKAQCEEQ